MIKKNTHIFIDMCIFFVVKKYHAFIVINYLKHHDLQIFIDMCIFFCSQKISCIYCNKLFKTS